MPIVLTSAEQGLIGETPRMAVCWKVEREDGTIFRFTSHDSPLTLSDGNTYVPMGGFNASALERTSGLSASNFEVVGVLSSAAITEDDLRAGLYRDAEITEYEVSWLYPWIGPFTTKVFQVVALAYGGEYWEAQVASKTHILKKRVGKVFGRVCWNELGDDLCQVNLAVLTDTDSITAINTQRFELQSGLTDADDYWQYGKITFTSGNNNGMSFDVAEFTQTAGVTKLQARAPFDFQIGDTFSITPGCDKLFSTCGTKFSNAINFGGQKDIPGMDHMIRTPDAK